MKHIKLFEQFINEDKVHYYGVDSETERRAGGAGSMGSNLPWKNGKALVSQLKKYYIKPEVIRTLSTSRVTIKPGSSSYVTFNTKDGFDMDIIISTLFQGLERFCKVNGLHIMYTDIQPTSFSLMIQKNYNNFTDNSGKIIDISKLPKGHYISK